MKPGRADLPTIWRGCNYAAIIFQWKDQNNNPCDLTGWTPTAFTRNGVNLNAIVTQAVNGFSQISLTQVQTATVRLGADDWNWFWEHGGVIYPPILYGKVEAKEPFAPPQ